MTPTRFAVWQPFLRICSFPRFLVSVGMLLAFSQQSTADQPLRFPPEYRADIMHIRLEARVDLENKRLDATAVIDLAALDEIRSVTFDAVDFSVKSVARADQPESGGAEPRGIPCDFDYNGKELTIVLSDPLKRGDRKRFIIDYCVRDPSAGLYFFKPDKDDPEAPYQVWSQGQTDYNRYWLPCFDHPSEMQTSEILCTVDKRFTTLSNGKLIEQKDNPDGTRTDHWRQERPHVAYLMALVVGEFATRTDEWKGVPLSFHARPVHDGLIDNSFKHTADMVQFFSDRIGVPYPWEKYAQVCVYEYVHGGMENTSCTVLTEDTLHDEHGRLDGDSDGLVAHELAHQWWGDLLTCRDWAHIWLNEGFATYFEALWDEHHGGPGEFAVNMNGKLREALKADTEPIVDRRYNRAFDQFDNRAYPKGAWVLHMIRRRLGDEQFWKAINAYCEKYRHQNVETADFRRVVEQVSGRSFERFFYDWTERAGHPVVRVEYEWDGDSGTASVEVEQKQEGEEFWFPLQFEFHFDEQSKPVVLKREVRRKFNHWLIPLPRRPALLRIDPEQAVLMELQVSQPRNLWAEQLKRDPSPAARMTAADHFGESHSTEDEDLLIERLSQEPFWAVQTAIVEALSERESDAARDALIGALSLADARPRAAAAAALAEFTLDEEAEKALADLLKQGNPSYQTEVSAIRSYCKVHDEDPLEMLKPLLQRESHEEIIRRTVLECVGDHSDPEALDLLIDWSRSGRPLECRRAAIRAIGNLVDRHDLKGSALKRAVEAVTGCLPRGSLKTQLAALDALKKMGDRAGGKISLLEQLARGGKLRIRREAKEAIDAIREKSPIRRQLDEFRDWFDKLDEKVDDFSERLDSLEDTGDEDDSNEADDELASEKDQSDELPANPEPAETAH